MLGAKAPEARLPPDCTEQSTPNEIQTHWRRRAALVQANEQNRLVGPLTELLLLSWGPMQVVADATLPDAERVLIFGSWAARYLGQPGPPPHDLDVLVVGRPSRESVYDAADHAQQRLGIPVNPVIRTTDAWRDATDPFVQQIRSGPYVPVLEPDNAVGVSSEKAQVGAGGR